MYIQTKKAQSSLVESITSTLTCLSMGLGSIIMGFVKGWRLALVLTAYLPVVFALNLIRTKINEKA